jgi:hypothetical protein
MVSNECSALGVYDGKAYDALWARVQQEPLNQTEVTEAYEVCVDSVSSPGIWPLTIELYRRRSNH